MNAIVCRSGSISPVLMHLSALFEIERNVVGVNWIATFYVASLVEIIERFNFTDCKSRFG